MKTSWNWRSLMPFISNTTESKTQKRWVDSRVQHRAGKGASLSFSFLLCSGDHDVCLWGGVEVKELNYTCSLSTRCLAEWALVSDGCIKAVQSCIYFEKSGFYIPPNRLSLDPKCVYPQSDAALGTTTSLHFCQSSRLTRPRFLPNSLVSSSRFSCTICPLRNSSWKIIRLIVFKTHYAFHICCTQSTGLEDIYTNSLH